MAELGPNPSGLCMCGCGRKTNLAPVTRRKNGDVKGTPLRFLPNHHLTLLRRYGPDHPLWNGGRHFTGTGYIKILLPDDPQADSKGYVLEHRVVARQLVGGRVLRSDELVHHKNGDKHDNRLENLEILTREEHTSIHTKERWADAKARGEHIWAENPGRRGREAA